MVRPPWLGTGGGSARQHAVFGGYPALIFAAQPWRQAVFDAGGAEYAGVTEGNQHGAFGMAGVVALDRDVAQLIMGTATRAGHCHNGTLGKSGWDSLPLPPFSAVRDGLR
jgi:hypothetical protein